MICFPRERGQIGLLRRLGEYDGSSQLSRKVAWKGGLDQAFLASQPGPIRRQLSLQPGDSLDAKVQAGRIMLTPRKKAKRHVRIVVDQITNFPVLSEGGTAVRICFASA